MLKKSIFIILISLSLTFVGCVDFGGSGSSSISGMHVPSGLK